MFRSSKPVDTASRLPSSSLVRIRYRDAADQRVRFRLTRDTKHVMLHSQIQPTLPQGTFFQPPATRAAEMPSDDITALALPFSSPLAPGASAAPAGGTVSRNVRTGEPRISVQPQPPGGTRVGRTDGRDPFPCRKNDCAEVGALECGVHLPCGVSDHTPQNSLRRPTFPLRQMSIAVWRTQHARTF